MTQLWCSWTATLIVFRSKPDLSEARKVDSHAIDRRWNCDGNGAVHVSPSHDTFRVYCPVNSDSPRLSTEILWLILHRPILGASQSTHIELSFETCVPRTVEDVEEVSMSEFESDEATSICQLTDTFNSVLRNIATGDLWPGIDCMNRRKAQKLKDCQDEQE